MVAGYVDGLYRWTAADWARFPAAVKVRIACFASTNDGHVLDIEAGCSAPYQAPNWVRMRLAAGLPRPVLYCNRSNVGSVLGVIDAAGLHTAVAIWLADWTGVPHLASGTIATQYASPSTGSGGHFDLSLVADSWPGVDPPPPTPAPSPGPGDGAGIDWAGIWAAIVAFLRRVVGL